MYYYVIYTGSASCHKGGGVSGTRVLANWDSETGPGRLVSAGKPASPKPDILNEQPARSVQLLTA